MSLVSPEMTGNAPDDMALADERVELSWREVDALVTKATNALLAAGLPDDARVSVFAPNSAETVLAYVGALHAGYSSVPLNFHSTVDEAAYILADSNSKIVFVGPETVAVAREAATKAGVDLVVGWRCPPTEGVISWDQWLLHASDAPPPIDRKAKPHLHYTSGTTGRPKGTASPPTMFPKADTIEDLFAALRKRSLDAGRMRAISIGPLYHTGPLGAVRMLAGGSTLVTTERFDAEKILATMAKYKVNNSVMVPTQFQRLLALPQEVREKYDVSSLKAINHTGAACPRDVKQGMIDWWGPVLNEAYGATESGTTNMISSAEWLERQGSVGKTLPPFELLIYSDEGATLGPNEVGQIFFRDTTGRGIEYHNDPEKTKEAHREPGVFTLGEIGYYDEAGYLYITDRVSDMIVSGGVNIYPAEVEKVLMQHPEVEDVAVIGAPNTEMGEEVKALVVPRDIDNPPDAATLDSYVRGELAGYKRPRSYEFVPDIGRNVMGKVNKRMLRRQYWPSDRTIGG